ncbi:cupin [Streptomyces nogalater]
MALVPLGDTLILPRDGGTEAVASGMRFAAVIVVLISAGPLFSARAPRHEVPTRGAAPRRSAMSLFVPRFDDTVLVRDDVYLLDGEAEVLSGDDVVTAGRGDLVIVPPDRPHSPSSRLRSSRGTPIAAAPGTTADLLVVIAPGVERFEYFRHLQRVRLGEAPAESLLEVQELYDNHFLKSAAWDGRRR